jgi:hypothetical protein
MRYYGMNRGINGETIFEGNQNKSLFLDFLEESVPKYNEHWAQAKFEKSWYGAHKRINSTGENEGQGGQARLTSPFPRSLSLLVQNHYPVVPAPQSTAGY